MGLPHRLRSMGTRIASDARDYLHYTKDDDFTVDLHSNDAHAVRMSLDASVRAHWRLKLPLALKIPQKEYEVAVAKFTCRNHQTNSPKSVRVLEKDSANIVVERPLPVERYSTEGDMLAAIYETLDGGEVFPKIKKCSSEEFGILAVREDVGLYAILDFSWLGTAYIDKLRNGNEFELRAIWNDVLRATGTHRVIRWREIQNGQNKVLQGVMARPGVAYHSHKTGIR